MSLPPIDAELLRTCSHPMDLLAPQAKAMFRDHQVMPNALLLGYHSRRALGSRKDFLALYTMDWRQFYGLHVVMVEQRDCFELAYLPCLPKKDIW